MLVTMFAVLLPTRPGRQRLARATCSLSICLLAAALAGQGTPGGSVAFRQACLDATTDALVLNVAAHPDDEADRTLVWLRHKLGLRTVTLYSTCGSGGQNAVGREIGPELARLRVRETLAAARHTGVDVRWLGFPDFGYSKTAVETLSRWGGRAELLRRVSSTLAELDPDVVFTNHDPNRGHGHHRASAIGIRAVLEQRARDGRVTPLYQRAFVTLRTPPDWECDPFEFDAVRGVTFARQASRGRHEHRTQGPWSPHDPTRQSRDRWRMVFPDGENVERAPTQHFGSVLGESAFQAQWARLGRDLGQLGREFAAFGSVRPVAEHVKAARALLPDLRAVREELGADTAARRAARRLSRRIDALERVVLAGSGVQVEAYLQATRLVRGGSGVARVLVHAADGVAVTQVRATCRGAQSEPASESGRGARMLKVAFELTESSAASTSVREAGDGSLRSPEPWPVIPFEPEWIDLDVRLVVDGLPLRVLRRLAADVEPALTVAWGRQSAFVESADIDRVFPLHLRYGGGGEFEGAVEFELPTGVQVTALPEVVKLSLQRPIARVLVRLRAPDGLGVGSGTVRARLGAATGSLHLVPTQLRLDPELKIGLVRGPDDTLQRTLEDLGIDFDLLDETRLAVTDLSRLSALVLDIRAYHHRPDLADHRDRLIEFCSRGGRVLSFYHKPHEWNERDGHPLLSPYALEIGRSRVSEETAAVTLLQPEHRLWNHPHHITARDFDGWVQERGLNFPAKWGDAWIPMVEMADTREKALRSGLLFADHGEGDFVYCSLALYRQLRNCHPGAARILVNLLTR